MNYIAVDDEPFALKDLEEALGVSGAGQCLTNVRRSQRGAGLCS